MNKEEKILNEIKETRNHLRSLELEVSSLRLNKKRWKPSLGEVYYCINFGHVSRFINTFGVDDNISTGNYFQSKEEVSFEIERLKILEQLKSYSYSFTCKDWKDCYNNINSHYSIFINSYTNIYKQYRVKR